MHYTKNSVLTDKQKRIFDMIRNAIVHNGQSPTVKELKEELGLTGIRTVVQHLESLEKKGFIHRKRYQARGIEIVEQIRSGLITLPVVSAAGCDDMSVFAGDNFDEHITIDESFLHNKKPEQVVVVEAKGNSMVDAGINDGDFVITELTQEVRDGEDIVAVVDGMAVIKEIHRTPNATILKPVTSDSSYQPIIMKHDFNIVGRVLEVIKNKMSNELVYEPV